MKTTSTAQAPAGATEKQERLIPFGCCTTRELAKLLKTNEQTLSRNIKGIRHQLGPRVGKWSLDQVAQIIEHWGTVPEDDNLNAA